MVFHTDHLSFADLKSKVESKLSNVIPHNALNIRLSDKNTECAISDDDDMGHYGPVELDAEGTNWSGQIMCEWTECKAEETRGDGIPVVVLD